MYVVIGANGFLGSYIVRTVLDQTREQVLAICRHTEDAFMQDERLRWMAGDIEDTESVARIADAMAIAPMPCKVAYLAACHHPDVVARQPVKAWHTNITCLSAFLEKAENMQCLFYPSTDTVYGEGGGVITLLRMRPWLRSMYTVCRRQRRRPLCGALVATWSGTRF